ncbi:MAG: InlB B-repeat-containing protein [Treponema sp.]|nr:InlB B-repeat-containing protein [Treponema sp.]
MGLLALLVLSCPIELENRPSTFYTVSFETGNGGSISSQYVAANAKVKVPQPAPSKEGYTFTGWYVGESGERYYFNVPVTADITLYAKWEPKPETGSNTKTFWALRIDTNEHYQIQADLLAEGKYCKIWVEQDPKGSVSPAIARDVARNYDENIYAKMMGSFDIGQILVQDSSGGISFTANSIMEFADWLTDEDGKLSILFLDIQDTYDPSGNRSYVGGYFWIGNLYQRDPSDLRQYSNQADMIYLDTYPGKPGEKDSNATLAHEMQHLMNFVTSVVKRNGLMELWIDEGLSSAAEYIYLGDHSNDRYEWFQEDRKGTLAKGNNFFVWGNYSDDSILDDYATVYLFFQWLRLQAEDKAIYKNVIGSQDTDYRAVTEAMKPFLGSLMASGSDWNGLLKTWLAANYINAPSGPYGYKGEPKLGNVRAKTAPAGTTSLQLLPGEGVYSMINAWGDISSYASNSGPNIKYTGIHDTNGLVSDRETYPGGALLTYNASPNAKGSPETGKLTGIAGNPSAGGVSRARSAGGTVLEGPVSIDARDMLVRNGQSGEGFDRALFPGVKVFAREAHGE